MALRRFFKWKVKKIDLYTRLQEKIDQQIKLLLQAIEHGNINEVSSYSVHLLDLIRQLDVINERFASKNNEIASKALVLLKSLRANILDKIKEIASNQRSRYEEENLKIYLSTYSNFKSEKNLVDLYEEIDQEITYQEGTNESPKTGQAYPSNEGELIASIIFEMNLGILAGINSVIANQIKADRIKLNPDLFPGKKFPDFVVRNLPLGENLLPGEKLSVATNPRLQNEASHIELEIDKRVMPDYHALYDLSRVSSPETKAILQEPEIKEILQKFWYKQKEAADGKLTKEAFLTFINSEIARIGSLLKKLPDGNLSAIKIVYERAQERLLQAKQPVSQTKQPVLEKEPEMLRPAILQLTTIIGKACDATLSSARKVQLITIMNVLNPDVITTVERLQAAFKNILLVSLQHEETSWLSRKTDAGTAIRAELRKKEYADLRNLLGIKLSGSVLRYRDLTGHLTGLTGKSATKKEGFFREKRPIPKITDPFQHDDKDIRDYRDKKLTAGRK